MGVMACNRKGCDNVMCVRHSYTYGYICNECFEELVESGRDTNIEEFMKQEKENYESCELNSHEYFNNIFSIDI